MSAIARHIDSSKISETNPSELNAFMRDPSDLIKDLRLVKAAMKGNATAIDDLVDRLRCVSRFLTGKNMRLGRPLDEHDLADLTQDTIIILLDKLPSYEGRAPLEAWIYRICVLELMNGIRRKRRWSTRQSGWDDIPDERSEQPTADQKLDRESLLLALDQVGGIEADLIRLKHFEGLTFAAIAAQMGIPQNTAKTRYYRGLTKLRRTL